MSGNEGEPTSGRRKLTRNRRVASCNPCRTRRIRCDRGKPCAACTARGEEIGCTWDATALPPVYERREANETESLRAEVERLQRLVDVFASAARPPIPLANDLSFPSLAAPPPYPPPPSLTQAPPVQDHALDSAIEPQKLEEEDLVKQLSELTIKAFNLNADPLDAVHSREGLVKEATQHLDSDASSAQLATSSTVASYTPSASTGVSAPLSIQQLVGRIPPKMVVDKAVKAYFATFSYYVHPFTRKQYFEHEKIVFAAKKADRPAPPISLAVVFTICTVGLLGGDPNVAIYSTFSNDGLAAKFAKLAGNALALTDYLLKPSLDAIRVLVLLSAHHAMLAPGDDGALGILYITQASNAALQLNLHRDPDTLPANLTFAEKEDRRRLYWFTFSKDAELATLLGRRSTVLHGCTTSTRLPLDIGDECLETGEGTTAPIEEENRMTFILLRIKLSQLSEQITAEAFGRRPITYARILELDSEVRQQQRDLPLKFRTGVSPDPLTTGRAAGIELFMLEELQRLHRPYLARSHLHERFTPSRRTCLDTAFRILELHAHPLSTSSWVWCNYASIMSATILLIDLALGPNCPDSSSRKKLACELLVRLEKFKTVSTTCRRGIALLQFLLDKLDSPTPSFRLSESQPPSFKRIKPLPTGTPARSSSTLASPWPDDPELAHESPFQTFSSFSTSSSSTGQPSPPDALIDPSHHTPRMICPLPSPANSPINSSSHPTSATCSSYTPALYPADFSILTYALFEEVPDVHDPAVDLAAFDFGTLFGVEEVPPAFSFGQADEAGRQQQSILPEDLVAFLLGGGGGGRGEDDGWKEGEGKGWEADGRGSVV